jgi:hypothetical protein
MVFSFPYSLLFKHSSARRHGAWLQLPRRRSGLQANLPRGGEIFGNELTPPSTLAPPIKRLGDGLHLTQYNRIATSHRRG